MLGFTAGSLARVGDNCGTRRLGIKVSLTRNWQRLEGWQKAIEGDGGVD